ncbi:MAG: hypothetical protein WA129_06570 [Acidovorax sp.]
MGQKDGVLEERRSQKWTAAADLQPTISKSDSLLAIFGRIASLQIACLAELNGALCASHCIPNPAVKMHKLLLYEP